MKYSIIIPTYNKLEQTLKKCIESLVAFTDINTPGRAEVIVVANGCTDGTRDFIEYHQRFFPTIQLLWFDKAIGYTKATNEGIKKSTGDYVVLLNNDTIFLDQPYNTWLDILEKPFLENPKVGITGPMKTFSDSVTREFLIFFCVMIARKVINKIGLLDEIFSPGYGEDTDYCFKAEDAGFDVLQVPQESKIYYAEKRMTGNFPIFHEGNVTFKNWPGGEQLIQKNNNILSMRYAHTTKTKTKQVKPVIAKKDIALIKNALLVDGYMADSELLWLARMAKNHHVIVEIGSWHGKSSRAIADNLPPKGILYCVDHWMGSEGERQTHHASAALLGGDHAFDEFLRGNFDLIQKGKIIPLRMSSENAASFFRSKNIKADAIFIDGEHTYQAVKADNENWYPVLKENGILCGHDYAHVNNPWPGVRRAVDESFKNVSVPPNTSIWMIKKDSAQKKMNGKINEIKKETKLVLRPPQIFDCFTFNNELDILDIRFAELYDTVDRFIICESFYTHAGEKKELVFNANLERFYKYLNKVTYLVVEQFPEGDSWTRERFQRDHLMQGLGGCEDYDTISLGDVDEIPSAKALKKYHASMGTCALEQTLYYYNFNTVAKDAWKEARVTTYALLKAKSPCGIRYETSIPVIKEGGWHFSYMGGVESVMQKIKDTAHQEYNKPEFLNPARIKQRITGATDIFGRKNLKYFHVHTTKNLPDAVVRDSEIWKQKGYIIHTTKIQQPHARKRNRRDTHKKSLRKS